MKAGARIVPLGDSAVLVQMGDQIDFEVNQRLHALEALLHSEWLAGATETVPAYTSLLVCYDPLVLDYTQVAQWLSSHVDRLNASFLRKSRRFEVPVRYGGDDGPDLEFVASYHHLTPSQVARIHAGRIYLIYMMGFTPGFPYMGKLDEAIVTPRLETPRTHVPQGTVAIAGAQTGIYPLDSPGGWRLIGRTSLTLFDPQAASPFLFNPGDEVNFVVETIHA